MQPVPQKPTRNEHDYDDEKRFSPLFLSTLPVFHKLRPWYHMCYNRRMKRRLIATLVILIALTVGYLWLRANHDSQQTPKPTSSSQKSQPNTPQNSSFNKQQYSTTDPASIWVMVNKSHPLNPKSYVPNDLVLPNVAQRVPGTEEMKMRAVAAAALERMFSAAQTDGIKLLISTAYRGYSYQTVLYNNYVKTQGQAVADTQSARPGYSEHQTGLAVDIRARSGVCSVEQCFGNTPEGKWLAANAYKYGFWLRYPQGKDAVTGYEYEPWHYRYVGTSLAGELRQTNTATLEEFFGISGGTRYH